MGQYLSTPVTDKESFSQHYHLTGIEDNGKLSVGISSQQGWRRTQEDSHLAVQLDDNTILLGVFDGHGGPEVAQFVSEHIHLEIVKLDDYKNGRFKKSLVAAFHEMDSLLKSDEGTAKLREIRKELMGYSSEFNAKGFLESSNATLTSEGHYADVNAGCTAIVALLHKEILYVANAGDSRAVISRNGTAIPLSQDHKPSDENEKERIVAAGGFLSDLGGICRVNGNLSLSRAIGDLRYKLNDELPPSKQIITAEPDVEIIKLVREDEFLVLACDGIWDVMSNQEVVVFVREKLFRGISCEIIASEILDRCLATDPRESHGIGCDNMTCCIVAFDRL